MGVDIWHTIFDCVDVLRKIRGDFVGEVQRILAYGFCDRGVQLALARLAIAKQLELLKDGLDVTADPEINVGLLLRGIEVNIFNLAFIQEFHHRAVVTVQKI